MKYQNHHLIFYSNLANWLFNHSSNKMPAAQWLGTIKALKNTPQDEVYSLGLADYLNSIEGNTKVLKSGLCAMVSEQLAGSLRLELLTRKLSRFRPDFKVERFDQELLPKKVRKLLINTMVLDCFKFSSFNYRIIKYRFDGGWFGSIDTCIVFDNKWEQLRPKRCYTMLEAVDIIYSAISEKFKSFISVGDETSFERYSTLGKSSQSASKQVGDRQIMFKSRNKKLMCRVENNSLVLGGSEWTPHDLRRTGATLMQELVGDNSFLITNLCLGHSVITGSAKHYMFNEYAKEKYSAWQKLGNYLYIILK